MKVQKRRWELSLMTHPAASVGLLLMLTGSTSAQTWQFNLPGRDYLATDRLVSAVVFHWFTSNGGQQTGPWPPVEGRVNWTGEPPFWIRQIKDIMDANTDVMYVHLMPADEQQRTNLFAAYAQLRAAGYDVPAIAPFLDPLITWSIRPAIDLSTSSGKDEFVAQYTRFFNQYFAANADPQAESHLLHIGGKVVLNTWHCNAGFTNNTASLTRGDVETRLAAAFGGTYPTFNHGIYMVATPNGTAPSFADEKIHQFSAALYYAKHTYNNRKAAGLKPGYWDQNIRDPGSFHARDGGTHYTDAWAYVNSVKTGGSNVDGESNALPIFHVNIESWNEYDEGSGIYAADPGPPYISPTNHGGHTDVWSSTNNPRQYIDTTAAYAAVFNDRPARDAVFLGCSGPTVPISAGHSFNVQIVARNQGNTAWNTSQGYRLGQPGPWLYRWTFDNDANGWSLTRNAFGTSGNTSYENGGWNAAYGQTGGGLQTRVGNVNSTLYTNGASAGFARSFHLDKPGNVLISFRWRLVIPGTFEGNEFGEGRFELDGQAHGMDGQSYLARFTGGPSISQDTGWRSYSLALALSGPADHVIELGAWNNRKSAADEYVDVYVDDVMVVDLDAPVAFGAARVLIDEAANEVADYGGIFRGRPVVFDIPLTAPRTPGLHHLGFQMLQEPAGWFGERLDVQVDVFIPGDFDRDNDVDQEDFGPLQQCLGEEGRPCPSGCENSDLDEDGDVDRNDLSVFQSCMAGPDQHSPCVD
jgi:hypothetical protein